MKGYEYVVSNNYTPECDREWYYIKVEAVGDGIYCMGIQACEYIIFGSHLSS